MLVTLIVKEFSPYKGDGILAGKYYTIVEKPYIIYIFLVTIYHIVT